ncbi:MAG: hypothetical protein H6737_30020 [Alphaproteobacteria bacterium]|nr:hypothetical protein [Alphaproteobacteria bacterium]
MSETVSDPRAYVRQAFVEHPANWAHTAAYNLDDPAVVDPVIDKAMNTRRRQWKGELPNDKNELDAFIRISKGMYTTALTDTPELRARVEEKVRQHFENPPITREGDRVHVELGWAPGPLEKVMRSGWNIAKSDAVEERELKPEHVYRAFRQAYEAHPDAKVYSVTVEVPQGTRSAIYTYEYPVEHDRLYIRGPGGDMLVTTTRAGGIQGLIAGSVPTHSLKLESTINDATPYQMR